MYPKWL